MRGFSLLPLTVFRFERENEISPGSGPSKALPPAGPLPLKPPSSRTWDAQRPTDVPITRAELSKLDSIPRLQTLPRSNTVHPMAPSPWSTGYSSGDIPAKSQYQHELDDPQLSPGHQRKSVGPDEYGFSNDERRPSVASANTASSSGSKSSASRFHKKLHGFFGDEFPGDTAQGPESSQQSHHHLSIFDQASAKKRYRRDTPNNANGSSSRNRIDSPGASRPRTPQPSSEVVPWVYQDQVR